MKKLAQYAVAMTILAASGSAFAEQAIDNVNVTQIGTYTADTVHYVWFSGISPECSAASPGVYSFNEALPGGKAVLASLTTALVNNRKVMVRSSGCAITEIYLR